MVRTPCCKEEGIKKGAWTREEDQKLIAYLQIHGEGAWRTLPQKAGLKRCGKGCRLRWVNYLRPDLKRGDFTPEEEDTIIKLHARKGNKWSEIATSLAGRTDNEIKNYWNTNLKKRFKQKSIDPIIYKPVNPTDQTGFEPKKHKFTIARILNRVARKYAVDLNRDLLTGIITENSTIIADDSKNSGEVDSTEYWTSTLLNKINNTSTSTGFSDNCSFTDGFNELFSNEEISDIYTNVDNVSLMEELKGILSYGGGDAGDIKESPEVNVTDDIDFLDSWYEEDNLDLEKFVGSLDSKIGVFV